jgi:hypothetical protein
MLRRFPPKPQPQSKSGEKHHTNPKCGTFYKTPDQPPQNLTSQSGDNVTANKEPKETQQLTVMPCTQWDPGTGKGHLAK